MVHGTGNEIESDVLKGRSDEVTDCRNGEPELVELDFKAFRLSLESPHFEAFRVFPFHEKVDENG